MEAVVQDLGATVDKIKQGNCVKLEGINVNVVWGLVIKGELLLSRYERLLIVQYGEIGRWSA